LLPSSDSTPPKKPVTCGSVPAGGKAWVSWPVCVFFTKTTVPGLKATSRPSGVLEQR
jgi:hypothetical protein